MRVVDVFCGCGGLSLGLQNAGFEVISGFDNWAKAVNVYNENFDHTCFLQDLSNRKETVKLISSLNHDMIVGGPPCQDFSSAGKRDITLGRADLTYDYAYLINIIKPNWFIMENVDRVRKSHILHEIIEDFKKSGYGLTSVILDASYCNTPQKRKRFFLIGELGGQHNILLPYLQKKLANIPMTIRDYLGNTLGLTYYYRHPRNYSRRGIYSIDEPSPTVRGVNRPLPKTYVLNQSDSKEADLSLVRSLTTIERSYIQTFPKNFVFKGTKTDLEQMIGNAVPVNLATFVGEGIKEYLKDKKYNVLPNNMTQDFKLCDAVLKKKFDFIDEKKGQLDIFTKCYEFL